MKFIQSNEVNIYKNWKDKIFWEIYSSKDIPNLNNHEISDIHIKCEICTRQL